MRTTGVQDLSFLEGKEVIISSGWLPLSRQMTRLRDHNKTLDRMQLTRLPLGVFDRIQKGDLEQVEAVDGQYPSFSLELFSPAATAVASWTPLLHSCVSDEIGGALDLLPPIREWRAAPQAASMLSIVNHAFFDVSGLSIEEITEKISHDPSLMAGHEIALAVYLQDIDLRGYLSHNRYRIVVPGVTMSPTDALHPSISWDGTHGLMNGLGVFAERADCRLREGTLLSIVTDRTVLARLS